MKIIVLSFLILLGALVTVTNAQNNPYIGGSIGVSVSDMANETGTDAGFAYGLNTGIDFGIIRAELEYHFFMVDGYVNRDTTSYVNAFQANGILELGTYNHFTPYIFGGGGIGYFVFNDEDSVTSAVYQVGIGVEFFFDECAIDTRSDIPEIGQCELDPIGPIYTGYSITLRGGDVFSDFEDIPYVNVMITKRF
jgi:hypothetical protein